MVIRSYKSCYSLCRSELIVAIRFLVLLGALSSDQNGFLSVWLPLQEYYPLNKYGIHFLDSAPQFEPLLWDIAFIIHVPHTFCIILTL